MYDNIATITNNDITLVIITILFCDNTDFAFENADLAISLADLPAASVFGVVVVLLTFFTFLTFFAFFTFLTLGTFFDLLIVENGWSIFECVTVFWYENFVRWYNNYH